MFVTKQVTPENTEPLALNRIRSVVGESWATALFEVSANPTPGRVGSQRGTRVKTLHVINRVSSGLRFVDAAAGALSISDDGGEGFSRRHFCADWL